MILTKTDGCKIGVNPNAILTYQKENGETIVSLKTRIPLFVEETVEEIDEMLNPNLKPECSRCCDDNVVYTRGKYRLCEKCYDRYAETITCPSCGQPSDTATIDCSDCTKQDKDEN
jgi:hypothetical protein